MLGPGQRRQLRLRRKKRSRMLVLPMSSKILQFSVDLFAGTSSGSIILVFVMLVKFLEVKDLMLYCDIEVFIKEPLSCLLWA